MNIYFETAALFTLFRERAGLTKTDVANYLNVTTATITNYEKGFTSPSIQTLSKLKKLYGKEFSYALNMIYDENKKAYLNFKDSSDSADKAELSFEQKYYPGISRIKEYLKTLDNQ